MLPQEKKAFTLVELLVVIAIITILASMLLPTLEKSLDAARTQKCSNQLKQIGTGFYLYADEYGGRFPGRGGTSGPIWWEAMRDYLGKRFAAEYNTYSVGKKPGDENIASCPVFDNTYSSTWPRPEINRIQYWQVISYDINCNLIFKYNYPQSGGYYLSPRPERVKAPSECVLVAEAGAHDGIYNWKSSEIAATCSVYYNQRHGNAVNNVRMDGSVRPERFTSCSLRKSNSVAYIQLYDKHCFYGWGIDAAYPSLTPPSN